MFIRILIAHTSLEYHHKDLGQHNFKGDLRLYAVSSSLDNI